MVSSSVKRATALTITVLTLMGCDDNKQREEKYKARAIEYTIAKKYDLARVEFKNAAKIDPTDPDLYYRLGLVDEAQGDFKNAYTNFLRSEAQDKKFAPALIKIAQYLLASDLVEESEHKVDTVLALEPENAVAHAMRAALKFRRKDLDGAEREARVSLAKDPGNVGAISILSVVFVERGDLNAARATLETGIARHPDEVSLLLLKIGLLRRLDDLPQIEQVYQKLFTLMPDVLGYRAELVQTFLKAGQVDDAERVWRAGVAAAPGSWEMKRELVVFLSENRGLDPAEAEVKGFLTAAPDNRDLYFWLADLYLRHNATDRAVQMLEQVAATEKFEVQGLNARASLARISITRGDRAVAEKLIAVILERNPNHPEARFIRASMAFDEGHYQSAVSDLRSIMLSRPRSPEVLQLLAEAFLRQGRLDLAIETQKKLVDLAPFASPARVRLAQLYFSNKDPKRALADLAAVTKADPAYPVGWESLARIAISMGDWPVAEPAISHLESLDGQGLLAAYLRGEVLAGTGQTEPAIALFTKVVSVDPDTPLAEHALASLVRSYNRLGRLPEARHYVESLNSDNPFIVNVLGECYRELGQTEQAVRAFETAAAGRPPARPEPYLNLAQVLMTQHKGDQSIDVLRKGAAALPANAQIPLMLAEIYGETGRYQEAIALYEDILTRNPGLDQAANNMVALITDYQYTDPAAMERARRVAERFQGATDPIKVDTLGWVQYRLGNVPEALILLGRAVGTGKGAVLPQLRYHYGAALLKANMKEKAKVQLQAATEAGASYPGIEDARKMLETL